MPDAIPTEPADIDDGALQAAEAAISTAIQRRDASDLTVLGFGEIAVAVGWPTASPAAVLKRAPVYANRAHCERHMASVGEYVERLVAAGAAVIPTSVHVVERSDGRYVGYAVQPVVPKALLAETVLKTDEPHADHPLLTAVREYTVKHATPELAVDMQIPNFAWDGENLVLLDITTPFMFTANGELDVEITPEIFAILPAPMRRLALREAMRIAHIYQSVPDTLSFVISLLYRIDQQRWAPAAAENFASELTEPVDLDAAEAEHRRLVKVLPFLARSSMAQRWWATTVRRQPFDFFITDSFSGDLL